MGRRSGGDRCDRGRSRGAPSGPSERLQRPHAPCIEGHARCIVARFGFYADATAANGAPANKAPPVATGLELSAAALMAWVDSEPIYLRISIDEFSSHQAR